jgi:CHASE3 domain sensor protein
LHISPTFPHKISQVIEQNRGTKIVSAVGAYANDLIKERARQLC